jgi:hypothetical protein
MAHSPKTNTIETNASCLYFFPDNLFVLLSRIKTNDDNVVYIGL